IWSDRPLGRSLRAKATARPCAQRVEELAQPGVELGGVAEDPLAARRRALPPRRLHALVGAEAVDGVPAEMRARPDEQVRLVDELQPAVGEQAQPAVMAPADPGAVDRPGQLLGERGDLDVAGAGHALQLGADPHRVAQVLERVRAHGEVELTVGERPRLAVAEVAPDPRLRAEALGPRVAVVAPAAAGAVG